MEEMKIKDILNKKLNRVKIINQQILDELLVPGEITESQEKQILKLKQEKYKERANYYKKLKALTTAKFARQKYDKIIKDCKDTECRTYYLSQSKRK